VSPAPAGLTFFHPLMLRFTTAGESHGPAIISIVEGVPAGLPLSADEVNHELARRQRGYGRGRRMQIESDQVEMTGGVRAGVTTGAPVAFVIRNADWRNWSEIMAPGLGEAETPGAKRAKSVTRPRPGHADMAGMLKHGLADGRDVLERASARETAARVAAGAVCKALLRQLGIDTGSHVVSLGRIDVPRPAKLPPDINAAADESPVRVIDRSVESRIMELIDAAKKDGDTLGGVVEVVCRGIPAGLGSHTAWERKLDGQIAGAMMSIQAVKGVEIGSGFEGARLRGSEVHDAIGWSHPRPLTGNVGRATNNAGGIEGGITNGEDVIVRIAMKPLSTLMRPLQTVDLETGASGDASVERSDVTALPALGVVAESMLAFVVARASLEKFGGDSLEELRRNFRSYVAALGARYTPSRTNE
jgi:chorismate synthase